MRWDPSARGWERKWALIERLHDDMTHGRTCGEASCFARSVVGVVVYIRRRSVEAGLCAGHYRELLGELERRGREQPDGTMLLGRRRFGTSRILADDEVIDGPLASGELGD